MFALHDIDTCLHGILIECIDQEAANNFCLVVQFPQKAFLAVPSNSRDGRVCPCILSAQIVAHFSPHCTQLLDYRVAIWLIHESYSIGVDERPTTLLKVETKLFHLNLQGYHTHLRLGHICPIQGV